MPYKIKLDSFEGPLDLLLFLIKKNEIDIYDIPISKITKQYLQYLEIIQLFDLEGASDFILMAATLMRIKAHMLLPKPEVTEDEEDIEDPRQELVHRLLEYKRFKDVAENLAEHEEQARKVYSRGSFKFEENGYEPEEDIANQASLFDLISAFQVLLKKRKKVTIHRVQEITVTLQERIDYILEKITGEPIKFSELFLEKDTKTVWIVTFIAILELVKRRVIAARQEKPFDEIYIERLDG
jgi:segregation and condensation protein A